MDSGMDKELRERLANFTREPDERLWETIAPRIDVKKRHRIQRGSKGVDLFTIFLLAGFMLSSFLKLPGTDSTSPTGYALPPTEKKVKDEYKEESVVTRSENAVSSGRSERVAGSSIVRPESIELAEEKKSDKEVAGNPEDHQATVTETFNTNGQSSETPLMENISRENISGRTTLIATNDTTAKMQSEIRLAAENASHEDAENKRNERQPGKVSIYVTAMPTFGYQRIESKTKDNVYIESIKKISAFSMERLGVRVEVGAEIPISTKIKVFSGVVYFQRKQTIDYTVAQVDTTFIKPGPNGDYIVDTELKSVAKSFEYELKNIGLNVGINYQLSKGKLLHSLGTGFEFHYALNKLSDEVDQTLTNNPSAYVFYNLYYRLQYPSEGRLKAIFQPTLNYSFYISQNLNAPFYAKPYGLGLNLGFTYNF